MTKFLSKDPCSYTNAESIIRASADVQIEIALHLKWASVGVGVLLHTGERRKSSNRSLKPHQFPKHCTFIIL